MKIEIGRPSSVSMTYDEAVLYCFCLGNDWRLPNTIEYMRVLDRFEPFCLIWDCNRDLSPLRKLFTVPVRDAK